VREAENALHAVWQTLWYHGYRKPSIIIATNEKEAGLQARAAQPRAAQKLGPLDVG